MVLWQGESRRKVTGGYRRSRRGKRRTELGREAHPCVLGADDRKHLRVRSGDQKVRLLRASTAIVTDPSTGKTQTTTIKTVVENPANPHYVRRNIITCGAIIDTELGRARITSRPGQHGAINAVLLR